MTHARAHAHTHTPLRTPSKSVFKVAIISELVTIISELVTIISELVTNLTNAEVYSNASIYTINLICAYYFCKLSN